MIPNYDTKELLKKIKSRQAVVSVVGIGYVGLPLAVAFAEAGFRVIGVDADVARVRALNRGESYIADVTSERLTRLTSNSAKTPGKREHSSAALKKQGRLYATTEYAVLDDIDVAIVCVPTPLSKTRDPDLSHIVTAARQIAEHLHPGMLVVLESTTYPGTTEEIILPLLQRDDGGISLVGSDFFLAFSPERIDPGRTDWTLRDIPKVVGGVTPSCLKMATALYGTIVEKVVPVSSTKAAEMTKLLENTFRATNIALVNEIAIMCDRLGIDVWEVIEAAETKPFGFMSFHPGPGLGGHCLPVDPEYLAWKLKMLNYNPRFIQLASEINGGMPAYVMSKISDALNKIEKSLKGSRVLLLGVAYKPDVADVRESPALDLIEMLCAKGVEVTYNDPFVPVLDLDGASMAGVSLDLAALQGADCVVITTAHKGYDWQWIVDNSQLVIDTRNATKAVNGTGRVVKL